LRARPKAIFHCRGSGRDGDAIALVRSLKGLDFLAACETLTGRPAPAGLSLVDREELERRDAERRAEAEKRETQASDFREAERRRLYRWWRGAQPAQGTAAEAYLERRSVGLPPGAAIRFAPDAKLHASGARDAAVIHTGPAMMAAIVGPDGRFSGLHLTWIDLAEHDGKARVADPETGEIEAAKKVRGSQKGGRIELVRCADPERLVLGEGIEEVLSVWRALAAHEWDLSRTAFWSSINMQNLGGPAVGSIPHPQRKPDALGRMRARRIPSETPDPAGPAIPVPVSVRELVLLGDGDSDRFLTETCLRRAARRYARRGRTIRFVWSPEGRDWNSVLREAAA
jgi:hypothetical protein